MGNSFPTPFVLLISEKRLQQHNGGCVSTFLQHFSTKSKKKLLPPVEKAALEFASNGRIPELLMVADGGLPKQKREPRPNVENRMQTPGLVAKLMGLESMPVVHTGQPQKALDSRICSDDSFGVSTINQGLCTDCGGSGMVELRLQKLQKTGKILERQPVKPICKGLISGSRKAEYRKLELPVKSPRLISRRSTSRLVQAVANKILEPGLHVRDRANCALSYRGSMVERSNDLPSESSKNFVSSVGVKESSVDMCNGSEEIKRIKSGVIPSEPRKKGSDQIQSKMKAGVEYKKKASAGPSIQINNRPLAIQPNCSVEASAHNHFERKKNFGNTMECKMKQTEKKQNELKRTKNFVALNKNIDNNARSRSPTRVSSSCRVELERNGCEKSMTQKRRAMNQNVDIFSTSFAKGRTLKSDVIDKKMTRVTSYHRSNFQKVDCDSFGGSSNRNGNSSHSATHEAMIESRVQCGLGLDAWCFNRSISDVRIRSVSSQNGMTLSGDELSSHLEEKIRGLSSLDEDELTEGVDHQGRSTIAILKELISALTMRVHVNGTEISKSGNQMKNEEAESKGKAKFGTTAAYFTGASDQPSPISSVLEAAFSNQSSSLSIDGSSGDNPQLVLLEIGNIIQSYPNVDLSNSATSLNINQPGRFDNEAIADAEMLFENICSYSDPKKESSFASFLLDIQENIINNVFHEGSHLRQFLLDCVVECIYMKLGHFCRSGYFTWLKLPSVQKGDWLVREVCQEIIEWKNSCGKRLDDLIQKEMNVSNLKWAECKVEAFGIRMEIQSGILQALIHEMVIDIC